jgi:hypothetical protein
MLAPIDQDDFIFFVKFFFEATRGCNSSKAAT